MPPTLLMVGNFMRTGVGARRTTDELATHLAAQGWGLRIASRRWNRVARLLDMLAQAGRPPRPNLLLLEVYSGPAFRWAEAVGSLARWRGLPTILVLHGGGLPGFARAAPARVRRLLGSAQAVVTPSPWLARELRDASPRPIRVIRNGMELAPYRSVAHQRRTPGLVLWMRGFHADYDPVLAVQVLARLPAGYRLRMLGRDEGDGTLTEARAVAARLGVAGRLEIPGPAPRSEIPSLLAGAEVLLNTSRVDNAPVSLAEAMAAGTPIVTTGAGGIPAMLGSGAQEVVVMDRDPARLADAILRLVREPELRERVVEAGRAHAATHDWSVVLPEWNRLIDEVTGVRPG